MRFVSTWWDRFWLIVVVWPGMTVLWAVVRLFENIFDKYLRQAMREQWHEAKHGKVKK